MHLLYLNPNGQMGGAEVALLDMLASIRDAEPAWKLDLIIAADGPLAAKASALGVNTIVLPFPRSLARIGDSSAGGPAGTQVGQARVLSRLLIACPGISSYTLRLRRTIRRLNNGLSPDVIHTNGFKMHVLGALAKPAGVPLIWHIHDYVSCRPFMARLIRALQNRSSLIIANSNSVKTDIENVCAGRASMMDTASSTRLLGKGMHRSSLKRSTKSHERIHRDTTENPPISSDDSPFRGGPCPPVARRHTASLQTLYNAVDISVFSPHGPHLDLDQLSALPRPEDFPDSPIVRVGLLATFARWKGHEVFLRALSLIPAHIAVRGYIIGGALYETVGSQYSIAELKGLAQHLGVSDRVGFTGFVDQPASAMRSLDIVVHASTQPEPFGLVIAEAMACGRAVIVSDAGGASELIEPGTSALVHKPGDAAQLAERIEQLATDMELRNRLGRAGRITAETRFDRSRLASELIPLYHEANGRDADERQETDHRRYANNRPRPAVAGLSKH